MLHVTVMVETHPEFAAQYRDAIMRHARNSMSREEGCIGFAVHVHESDPSRFFLYESYRSRRDFEEVHVPAPYLAEVEALTAPWVKAKELFIWEPVSPDRG